MGRGLYPQRDRSIMSLVSSPITWLQPPPKSTCGVVATSMIPRIYYHHLSLSFLVSSFLKLLVGKNIDSVICIYDVLLLLLICS